ncbi:MAG: right-handed parallel beta-helix repeat-containing protein [Bacteriovorax sp.]|nr:right-handed parallel beta-helix repeat-containing protein [Bacteriovorax sp.]
MKPTNTEIILSLLTAFVAIMPLSTMAAAPVQDECSFIREKLQNLPAIGGEVLVPAGIYTCAAPIVLDRSNTSLAGDGDVTIRLGNNINTPVIIMGDIVTPPKAIRNVQVSHLKIDGNRWNQKSECWGGKCDGGGTSVIRNNGITVRAVTKARIQDVYITSARSGGIVTEKGCYDLEVDNLTAVDNEFDGFAGYETNGARLTNLTLSHNRAAGISLDIRFNGNIFKNVKIESNGDVGIFMRDSSSNIFENVSIIDSGSHGVFMADADDDEATCPLSNEFQNLSVVHSRGMGFRLNNACEGNSLTGVAHFSGNRDGCVSESSIASIEVLGQILCQE